MTFIEHVFGLAPDNGSGSLELLMLLAPIAALAAFQLRRKRRIGGRPRALIRNRRQSARIVGSMLRTKLGLP